MTLAALLAVAGTACPPPPKPPEPPPPAQPPPKPKCESLDEKCLAKGDTAARVPGTQWVITPPGGWTYAQESDDTIAEMSADKKAVMVVATFDPPKVTWELRKLQLEMIDKLSKKLGVTPKNKDVFNVNIRQGEFDPAKLTLPAFEQDGGKRGSREGHVLVVTGTLEKGKKELMVVAFALDGDDSTSDAIGGAVQSLRPAGSAK